MKLYLIYNDTISSVKYSKITDEYFDELEEILIMADIGVNTVIKFMDRLVDRAKKEKIEDKI